VISLKLLFINDESIVQSILDDAPAYSRNIDGIESDPHGGRDTLIVFPPDCTSQQKSVLLIEWEGQSIGVVDLIQDFAQIGTAFIGLFVLREAQQGKGLGREAFSALEDYAKKNLHAVKLRLAIVDSNPVQSFWEKMGFVETGEIHPHEGQNIKSVKRLMEKTLARA